jgi:hypothetical protein
MDRRHHVGDVPAGVRHLVRRPRPNPERGARIQPRMISSAAAGVRQLNRRRRARRGRPRGPANSALGASRSGRSPGPGPHLRAPGPRPLGCRTRVTSLPIEPGGGRGAGRPGRPRPRMARAAPSVARARRSPRWIAPRRAPKVATRAGAASSASPVPAARSVTPLTWSRSSFQAARAPPPGEDIRHPDGRATGSRKGLHRRLRAFSPEEGPRHR